MGLKEEILGLQDLKVEEVEVPEWGGRKVRVSQMSGLDRDAYELEAYHERKAGTTARNVRARLVARCVVDEAGARVFGEGDIEALGAKNAKALDRLYDKARDLNGLSASEAKEIEGN